MEKTIKIKTKDGHIIYGNLNTGKKVNKKLIVFIHGFTGNMNEHQFYNGAKFFPAKGFDTFRFNLYSGEKKVGILRRPKLVSTERTLTLSSNISKAFIPRFI